VKDFGLVVFQDKPEFKQNIIDDPVYILERN
jgi:hypothetical protein